MNYQIATDAETLAYFQAHPEHQKLVIEDLAKFEHVDLDWGHFDGITSFVVVPNVGIVPSYVEDVILDDRREADWYDGIYEVYQLKIYKFLWFTAYYRDEHGEAVLEIRPLERFDDTVAEAEGRSAEYFHDVYGYWFEWMTKEFSNGKRFVALDKYPELSIADLEEVESFDPLEYDDPEKLWASIFRLEGASCLVGVNYLGSISVMPVDSEREARQIISEIWP